MARKKPWKLINGKIYQYKGYRSDSTAAYYYKRDLRWRDNLDVEILNTGGILELWVRPHIE